MTEMQEWAKSELAQYQVLAAKIRVAMLRHDQLLEEALPESNWPPVGVVPDVRRKEGFRDAYATDRKARDTRYYAIEGRSGGSNPKQSGAKMFGVINRRIQLSKQVTEWSGQLDTLADRICAINDPECSEILMRSFALCQSWDSIAEELNVSRRTVARRYSDGLEKYGTEWHRMALFGTAWHP